jgi:hypothetical protein
VSGWLWLQGKVVRFFAGRIMRHHHHLHAVLRVPLMDAKLVGPASAWGSNPAAFWVKYWQNFGTYTLTG